MFPSNRTDQKTQNKIEEDELTPQNDIWKLLFMYNKRMTPSTGQLSVTAVTIGVNPCILRNIRSDVGHESSHPTIRNRKYVQSSLNSTPHSKDLNINTMIEWHIFLNNHKLLYTMVLYTKVLYTWMKNRDTIQCIKFVQENKFRKCVPWSFYGQHDDRENLYCQNTAMSHLVRRSFPVDCRSYLSWHPFEFFQGHHCK